MTNPPNRIRRGSASLSDEDFVALRAIEAACKRDPARPALLPKITDHNCEELYKPEREGLEPLHRMLTRKFIAGLRLATEAGSVEFA